MNENPVKNDKVTMETSKGTIIIELDTEKAPGTVENFLAYVDEKFFDGTVYHRVIPDFMIQGGDPTGTGAGGPGYAIKDEFVAGHSNVRGTIAMANSGPNSGGSQFFINLVDNSFFDWDKEPSTSKHPVFGEVVEGMDIVIGISEAATGVGDKPIQEIKIVKTTVI